MSLINDALRRASQTHKQRPGDPPPGVPLEPVEYGRRGRPWLPIILVPVVLLLLGLGVWFIIQATRTAPDVTARAVPTKPAEPARTAAARPGDPGPAAAQPPSRPAAAPRINTNLVTRTTLAPPPETPALAPVVASVSTSEPPLTSLTAPSGSPSAPVATPPLPELAAPPAFPELELEGIFYRLRDPSVLISGKTVYVGGKVLGARVVSIERQSVTVEFGGKTKVLTME